jgi:hypothetical protein
MEVAVVEKEDNKKKKRGRGQEKRDNPPYPKCVTRRPLNWHRK